MTPRNRLAMEDALLPHPLNEPGRAPEGRGRRRERQA